MTSEELENLVQSGEPVLLLDVRSHAEFVSGHVRGAVHAPMTSVLKATRAVCRDKEDLLVLVCEHGPRAQMAKALLKWNGYKNLELLDGHMALWRRSNRAMVKGDA